MNFVFFKGLLQCVLVEDATVSQGYLQVSSLRHRHLFGRGKEVPFLRSSFTSASERHQPALQVLLVPGDRARAAPTSGEAQRERAE